MFGRKPLLFTLLDFNFGHCIPISQTKKKHTNGGNAKPWIFLIFFRAHAL